MVIWLICITIEWRKEKERVCASVGPSVSNCVNTYPFQVCVIL